MSETFGVVRLEGVRKCFSRERNPTSVFKALRNRILLGADADSRLVALDEVSCELAPGEKVALIGDNGSGKTTLLRVIAGLYQPTRGRVRVTGEVVLVAGLGVGMVDELSVEENILLYGAIYGLGRRELKTKIPEILEWADISDFRKAKFKTLSSGMRTRLAFSAMRHVDANIYLLDEVLSAGDRNFKAKCEAVFEGYRSGPKTFIVATHDVAFARRFADKALWLHKGKQMAYGEPDAVVEQYTSYRSAPAAALSPK